MRRGDHGEAISEDDDDGEALFMTLAEAVKLTGWRIHAHV